MARKRRKKGEKSRKKEAEESRKFLYIILGIGLILLIAFIALRNI